jgi:hypothetical protein
MIDSITPELEKWVRSLDWEHPDSQAWQEMYPLIRRLAIGLAHNLELEFDDEDELMTSLLFLICGFNVRSHPLPSRDWIRGSDLTSRWLISIEEARKLPVIINVYLLDPSDSPINITRHAEKWFATKTFLPQDYRLRTFWLSAPQIWWFRRDEIEFAEKLYPLIRAYLAPSAALTLKWLTLEEIETRWGMNPSQRTTAFNKPNGAPTFSISDLIVSKKLPAYTLMVPGGIQLATDAFILNHRNKLFSKCLCRLRDVRRFERENSELLHVTDKDLFILRIADYVRAWIRARRDLRNECIKERLYVRSSIQTKRCIMAHYEGRESDRLRKALDAAGAFLERSTRKGGKPKKDCPWEKTCTNRDCGLMDTSRKLALSLSS